MDPDFLINIIKERGWGPSILIVDSTDVFSTNISQTTSTLSFVNLLPLYGLNIYSVFKYDTLLMTVETAVP